MSIPTCNTSLLNNIDSKQIEEIYSHFVEEVASEPFEFVNLTNNEFNNLPFVIFPENNLNVLIDTDSTRSISNYVQLGNILRITSQ